jgi:hypothetical protein
MNETSIKQADFVAAKPNPWRPWVAASIAAVAILGIAISLMALLGLFKTPQNDTGTKSLAAALGLVGAVLSAVVALVGTIIKYSIDDRNARQADIEASRNYALALQAEQRNRIEAAIRAVDLLSENNEDATKSQMGGALLALVSLGELDLAVSLLSQLWPTGKTAPAVAEAILTASFRSISEQTQTSASIVLLQNASKIAQAGYNIWPITHLGNVCWRTSLNENCRLGVVLSAAEWLVSVVADQPPSLRDPALVLYQALQDPNTNIRDIAAACLRPVVKALPDSYWADNGTGLRVTVADIASRLRSQQLDGTSFSSYAEKYETQLVTICAAAIAAKAAAPEANPSLSG